MATDEYLWNVVLQQAAADGALDLEYLNDKSSFIVHDDSSVGHTVPSIEMPDECLFDDLFDFDTDVLKAYKKTDDDVAIADLLLADEDIANLTQDFAFTESFNIPDVKQESTSFNVPVPFVNITPEHVAVASASDHLYVADVPKYSISAPTTMVSSTQAVEQFTFASLSPELINRLLVTISNTNELTCDNDSMSHEDSSFAGGSIECSDEDEDAESEDTVENMEYFSQNGLLKSSKTADRKQRKMQQNRVAAYRYRQKKKAEQDAIRSEREKLEKRNASLRMRVQQMTQEIGYLRSLMADMVKVRSLKH